jgi:hypothetical protein
VRIPNDTIRVSHLRTYGTTGFAMDGVTEEPGCPKLYRAKYVDHKLKEPRSYPLEYGTLLHDAFFLAEEENLPLLPDALEKAWGRLEVPLGPDAYTEAQQDLQTYMDRPEDIYACIAVEQDLDADLDLEIDGVRYRFGGRLDWIGIDPEEPLTLIVRDYKSNRQPPSQKGVDEDNQMTHYIALIRANIEKYLPGVDPASVTIIAQIDAFKWYVVSTQRDHETLDRYLDWLRAITRRIVQDEEGEPVLNPGCSYCPLKYDCKAFRSLPGRGETLADRMSTSTDLEQRVYLMQQAELVIRSLSTMVDEVKTELKQEAIAGNVHTFNGIKYGVADDWATEWDAQRLHEVLSDRFYNVVNVTQYRVDALVKADPALKLEVDRCRTRYVKPTPKFKPEKADNAAKVEVKGA